MRASNAFRPAALLPSLLLISSLIPSTSGFFPSDWRERYFGNGGVSHEAQTRIAYNALAEKYFPDISPITANMIKARTTIAEANMKVDDDQTSSAKHFDGENFEGGQALLVQAKANVISALRDGNGESAREFLGAALHTLQDFYAHTNWIELGRSDINFDLGKAGVRLSLVTFGQQTCSECGFGGADRLLRGCHDCTTNTNGFNLLTSGYYEGEDVPPGDVDIPDWKCRHGGATDSVLGAALGVFTSSTFRDVTPGINKDSLNCFWSPHHFHHTTAAQFAAKSSIQYIEDIIAEGSLTDKERKILFGVGTTLAFAIDTTGSMSSIIAATREQAIAIARGRIGTKDEPIDYVVAPFNDPSTGPVMKTSDFDTFVSNVGTLSAFGGGDCPELAISGIIDALDVMEGGGDLFIMTDAVAKDYDELASTALEIAFNKQIRFHVFKFDSGCDDGVSSKRSLERRVDSTANRQYSLLAASTGGTYHSLPVSEANSISSLLDTVTLSESNTVLKISGDVNSTSTFDIPVDSKMTEYTISLRGAGVSLSLIKPDGSVLDTSSTGVTLTTVTDGQFLNVKSPQPGVWKLSLNLATGTSSSTFSCDVAGVSTLHLSKFNFVTLSGRPGHRGYYPITGQPAYNHDVAAVAVIDGTFDSAVFDLRDSYAEHVVDTNMEQGSGAEGAPPRNSFYGEMRLTNSLLYAYVEGTDDTGAPFQRVLASVFAPLLSNTTDTGFNSTDVWAGRNVTNTTSSSVIPSSTSTILNHTSIYPTTNTTIQPYPTSSKGHYYSGYPVPVYTWDETSYETKGPGYVKTHTKYATTGCDSLKPSTYTTTTTCTVTDEEPTPYTTVSTITVTTYVPILCATCTGGNYPHHTGKGPWYEEDKSVVKSGYGDYVSTVDYEEVHYTTAKATVTVTGDKDGYEHYPTETSAYPEYEHEHVYEEKESTTTCTESAHATKEEDSYETKTVVYSHAHEHKSFPPYPTGEGYEHTEVEYEHYTYSSSPPEYEHYSSSPVVEYSYSSPPSEYPYSSSIPSYSHSSPVHVSESEYTHTPEQYSSVTPSHYDVPSESSSEYVPVVTATVSYPPYVVNGTTTVKGSATASEYAPAEFTGAATSDKALTKGLGVFVAGFFGAIALL